MFKVEGNKGGPRGHHAARKNKKVEYDIHREEQSTAGQKQRKSKEEKAKHSQLAKEMRAVRFSVLPDSKAKLPVHGELREDLIGIVLPMGNGKTTLCAEEGWVDIDSLIHPRHRASLKEELCARVAGGQSVSEALRHYAEAARPALSMFRPKGKTIILAQSRSMFEVLNIQCVMSSCLHIDEARALNRHRADHEVLMMEKNMEEVILTDPDTCYIGSAVADMRWLAYQVCDAYDIPVAAPGEFGGSGATLEKLNLESVVKQFDRGQVARATVDYQVKAHGLKSYKGFGFNANDWAKVSACISFSHNGPEFLDSDWQGWPINLRGLSSSTDLSEHDDVQYIVKCHEGEHERFTTSLIAHWKGLGQRLDIRDRLAPLYGIRRTHWDAVFQRIRDGVLASNTYMGVNLLPEERELILSMQLLARGSIRSVAGSVRSTECPYPRRSPSAEEETTVSCRLKDLLYTKPDTRYEDSVVGTMVAQSKIQSLSGLSWDKPVMTRSESIALAVGAMLVKEWELDITSEGTITGIMHKIASQWYRVSLVRDEWSDFMGRMLKETIDDHKASWAIAEMLRCNAHEGTTGLDWSIRVFEALKALCVCCLVADNGAKVALQLRDGHAMPCVLGMSESRLWSEVIKSQIPRHAVGLLGRGASGLSDAHELAQWRGSPTVALLEMINATSWYPSMTRAQHAACLLRWYRICGGKVDNAVLDRLLDAHSKQLFGKAFYRVLDRLEKLSVISHRQGGFASTHRKSEVNMSMSKDGFWSGDGKVISKNKGSPRSRREDETDLEQLLDAYQTDVGGGQVRKSITPSSLLDCGLMVNLVLQDEGKGDVAGACNLIRLLAA